MNLILDKKKLFSTLNAQPFQPHKLIDDLLTKQYPNTYNQDVGVWEKYTLRQHTIMVMSQFEKYFSHRTLPAGIRTDLFRFILAVHDIGKPDAVKHGKKYLHHDYNKKYVDMLFIALKIDKMHTNLALTLVDGDPIGKFIRKQTDVHTTLTILKEKANVTKLLVEDLFKLQCIFYMVDAGSYTLNAGGVKSLDFLFSFDEQNNQMKFASKVQKRMNELKFN